METTMKTLLGINTRQPWIFGLAALGLALTTPVQAAPNFVDGAFIVARNDRGDEARQDKRGDETRRDKRGDDVRQDERNARKDESSTDRNKRQSSRREAAHEEPQGYGYGYERRQQQRLEEDGRSRSRR
jgi:hypothetical protein